MSNALQSVVLGTRGSALARWQTDYVSQLLRDAWPGLEIRIQIVTTQGDRVLDTPQPILGGKGVFTAELETDLRDGKIDYAVHSLKDLPTENPHGLIIGAVPLRSPANDVLISKQSYTLVSLPQAQQSAQAVAAALPNSFASVQTFRLSIFEAMWIPVYEKHSILKVCMMLLFLRQPLFIAFIRHYESWFQVSGPYIKGRWGRR